MLENKNSPARGRRSAVQLNEEYSKWMRLYKRGISPYEIIDKLAITEAQHRAYLARAIESGDTDAVRPEYLSCWAKQLPESIQRFLQVEGRALIKIMCLEDGSVLLTSLAEKNGGEQNEIQ